MSLNDDVDLLRKIPLLAKIHPSKLKLLAFTSERLCFEPGQRLFSQGDRGDAAYVIVSGEADVIVETPQGEIKVASVKQNDFIGEIAILCDVPRTATIQADTQVHTLKIKKDLFFTLVEEFPEMAIEIMRELAGKLESTTTQLTKARGQLKSAGIE